MKDNKKDIFLLFCHHHRGTIAGQTIKNDAICCSYLAAGNAAALAAALKKGFDCVHIPGVHTHEIF